MASGAPAGAGAEVFKRSVSEVLFPPSAAGASIAPGVGAGGGGAGDGSFFGRFEETSVGVGVGVGAELFAVGSSFCPDSTTGCGSGGEDFSVA